MDLPWRGRLVRLELTVRRFCCLNPACSRHTFAEDCGPNLPAYARRTLDVHQRLVQIALTAGGEAGARLARGEGLPVSADTLLRLVRCLPSPAVAALRVLGIDDLALRKGQHYATIFVDLVTHRPVDLVEEREAETVATWLRSHPSVQVVARDRSGAYADGISAAIPAAIQVADRFHLLKNASDALDGMLRGRRLRIEDTSKRVQAESQSITEPVEREELCVLSPTRQYQAQRRAARVARWEQVHALAEAGVGICEIARRVGICRKTVHRWLRNAEPPHTRVVHRRPGGLRSPTLQPFVPYLQDRWQGGCTNASRLYREISQQGYLGSRSLLAQAVQSWRSPAIPEAERERTRRMTRRSSLRWICLRPPDRLKAEERELLEKLLAQDSDLARGHQLVQQFRKVLGKRDTTQLDHWLRDAQSSGLPTFVSLANGIAADREAVDAALTLPWSNGQTEGQINRLKLIKRQGYGRAKLDLLRARVLAK